MSLAHWSPSVPLPFNSTSPIISSSAA